MAILSRRMGPTTDPVSLSVRWRKLLNRKKRAGFQVRKIVSKMLGKLVVLVSQVRPYERKTVARSNSRCQAKSKVATG